MSDDHGTSIWTTTKSCSGSICYYSVDLGTIGIPPPYTVEIATISNGGMGPYSLPVRSVGENNRFVLYTGGISLIVNHFGTCSE